MNILEIQNIHKAYGPTKALNGVGFAVPKGAIFGLLGPNGSGKTTLLSIILDVLQADQGTFSWFGENSSTDFRKRIGTLLETPNFYHYLSAEKNLEITRQISGRGSEEDIQKALKKVNLYERRKGKFSSYSLGMKQRLAIAGALLGDPSVLVLDEPTNGLDPVGIAEIRALIMELSNNGHTIIMASHLLDEVEKICTHVAIMKKGTLLQSGPVGEVLSSDDLVEVAAENMTGLANVIAQLPGLISHTAEADKLLLKLPKGSSNLEMINNFCFSHGVVLNHLYLKKQRLEARFFELTNN